MASVRGLLNIQSLNELTYENVRPDGCASVSPRDGSAYELWICLDRDTAGTSGTLSLCTHRGSRHEPAATQDLRTTAPRFKRHPLHTCTTKDQTVARVIAHGGSCVSVSSESTSSDERSQIVDPRPHADGTRSTRRPSHALV